MSKDDQVLSLLKDIDRKATDRDVWYRKTLEEYKGDVTKLKSILAENNGKTDKRMSVNELKFDSFKSEIRREINITRIAIGTSVIFTILIVGLQVSWYAKQPPQDVNPLAISKSITKSLR